MDSHRARTYGVSVEEYERMKSDQNSKCAICQTEEADLPRKLGIDHCHKTGKVRGLLCFKCNSAIGKLSSIILLKNAVKYLENSEMK